MLTSRVLGRRRTVLFLSAGLAFFFFFGFIANVTRVASTSYTKDTEEVPKKEVLAWDDLRPQNLRIAFIGDSLTRFQYMSLVYYLKTGNWNANFFDSHRFKGKNEFIDYTIDAMQPNEHCDCYRGGDWTNQSKGDFFT
jgi:hypothetical protein